MLTRPDRPVPQDLQSMKIVLLRGITPAYPNICAIGWVEDQPHETDEAATLHETLYFVNTSTGGDYITLSFLPPEHGVPWITEFFEYTKLEIFEGVTNLAVAYIENLLIFRSRSPRYQTKIENINSIYKK